MRNTLIRGRILGTFTLLAMLILSITPAKDALAQRPQQQSGIPICAHPDYRFAANGAVTVEVRVRRDSECILNPRARFAMQSISLVNRPRNVLVGFSAIDRPVDGGQIQNLVRILVRPNRGFIGADSFEVKIEYLFLPLGPVVVTNITYNLTID
jgi:hypothetical protein